MAYYIPATATTQSRPLVLFFLLQNTTPAAILTPRHYDSRSSAPLPETPPAALPAPLTEHVDGEVVSVRAGAAGGSAAVVAAVLGTGPQHVQNLSAVGEVVQLG